MSLVQIIQQIAATSSRKEKQAILEANSKDMFLAKFLLVTYNPRINFYMQEIKGTLPPQETSTVVFNANTIEIVLDQIAGRKFTGGAAREYVEDLYSRLSPDDRQLFAWMINRDIKAGCSVSTFNKVWPGLIDTVPYMRCSLTKHNHPKTWFEKDPTLEVYSQEKMDAMFANLTVDNGVATLSSRTGKPFPRDAFSRLLSEANLVFVDTQLHGELIAFDSASGQFLPREKSNGYMNSLAQGGDVEPNYTAIFVAWDMIPTVAAKAKGKHLTPYSHRFANLEKLLVKWKETGFVDEAGNKIFESENQHRSLWLVETRFLKSWDEINNHYCEMVTQGKEGTVVKHPDTIWEDGTSLTQIKIKQEISVELRIKGFNKGDGRLVNTFGSLICESEDGLLSVGVSGLSDKMREEIWSQKDSMIDKVVTVLGNKVMVPTESGGKYSIFLPRFIEIRTDKTVADDLQYIQDAFTKA